MKNFIKYITLIILGLSVLTACEEEKTEFNKQIVEFASDQVDVELLKLPVKNDTIRFTVQLMSAPLDKDVQVSFKTRGGEDVTAIKNEHYEVLNNSVTIPAGSVKAEVNYAEVIHDHFMLEETVTAKVEISSENSDVQLRNGQQILAVNMKKSNVCPLEHEEIEGIWEVNEVSYYDGAYDPYEVELEHVAGDTMMVKGLWNFTIDGNRDDIMAIVDLTPGEESFTIPKQEYVVSSEYGQVYFEGTGSSIQTCAKTISALYDIYVEAGAFDIITESVWTYMGPASEEKSFPYERKEKKTLKE